MSRSTIHPIFEAIRRLRRGLVLGLALVALSTACSGKSDGATGPDDVDEPGLPGGPTDQPGTPGGPTDQPGAGMVPDELVGSWYNGQVSNTNFYQPETGHWDNAGGTGMFYTLNADGTFEYGWRLYSQLYGCAMTVFVYRKGTVESDPENATVVLHTTYAKMHSEDSGVDHCPAGGNYDKDIEKEDEVLIYEFGQDDYGNEVLYLRNPDTTASPFRPMERD